MAGRQKGLGKGLGSLLGEVADINRITEVPPVTEEDLKREVTVRLRMIEPNRNQPRKDFDEESLQELADSIREHGVIQPLIVTKRGERYRIIAGERRWRAAKLAGLKEIPVIVKEYSDEEIAEIALIENIQRKDLNPIEEATAFQKLIDDYHLTQEALAERISKSRTVIANSLRLLKLPASVQELLMNGSLSTGHAKVLLGVDDAEKQADIAHQILERGLSVRETEDLVRSLDRKRSERKKKNLKNQEEYDIAARKLEEKLSTHVRFARKSDHTGKIEIDYYSLEDLERIIEHIR